MIETDLATMVATTDHYFTLLGTADYDLFAVEDELNATFEEPDVVARPSFAASPFPMTSMRKTTRSASPKTM